MNGLGMFDLVTNVVLIQCQYSGVCKTNPRYRVIE